MPAKYTKQLWLSLFPLLALNGCRVEFPDITLCSVSGIFAAGMNCSATGHDETSEMDAAAMIKFLEAGAICMSSDDRRREQVARDQACNKLGNACNFEMKKQFKDSDARAAKIIKKKAGR